MFKPEIKTKLLEALRGGNYKQNRGNLKHKDCFCANGVLCDLYAKEKGIQWELDDYHMYSILGKKRIWPMSILWWAFNDPHTGEKILYSIMKLNDNGMNFTEIAHKIESEENILAL